MATWTPDLSLVPDTSWASGYSLIWNGAGYPTHPTATVIFATITSTGDGTDRTAAINSAIDGALAAFISSGNYQVVLLGPGDFYCFDKIVVKNGVVLRGTVASPVGIGGTSVIKGGGSVAVGGVSGDPQFGNTSQYTKRTITSSMTKGSTTLTLSGDLSEFIPGHGVQIVYAADPVIPATSANGLDGVRFGLYYISGKSGQDITISPALPDSFSGGTAKPSAIPQASGIFGIEDLTVDGGATGIQFSFIIASWIKRVKVINHANRGIVFSYCTSCEVTDSWIATCNPPTEASNHGGFTIENSTACRLQNSIIDHNFPATEHNFGTFNSVFAYNYTTGSSKGLQANHGPWNSFNLFEGNITNQIQWDGYTGGGGYDTAFRNWFYGVNPVDNSAINAVRADRFGRKHTFFGNILQTPGHAGYSENGFLFGFPNIGNPQHGADANISGVAPWTWIDWDAGIPGPKIWTGTLTSKSSSTSGVVTLSSGDATDFEAAVSVALSRSAALNTTAGTAEPFCDIGTKSGNTFPVTVGAGGGSLGTVGQPCTFAPNAYHWQEIDKAVEATATLKENYSVYAGGIISGQSIGSDTQPNSMFLPSAPAGYSISWPYINSRSIGTPVPEMIPAGYYYVNGSWPVGSVVATPTFSPVADTYSTTQSVSITTGTLGATIRYTTNGTTPTSSVGTVYSGPISISSTTTLKAIAYNGSDADSSVRSGTYTIVTSGMGNLSITGAITATAMTLGG